MAKYQERDPITTLAAYLKKQKIVTDDELKAIEKDVRARVDQVEAFADASERPDVSEAFMHVYVD